jgi:hypothetical protein
MAEGGFVPWTILDVQLFGESPGDAINWGGQVPQEILSAAEDERFMLASGFSGTLYTWNPDTLNRDLNRTVWYELRDRLSSGQVRFALARVNVDDYYGFVDQNNKLIGGVLHNHTGSDEAFWTAVSIAKTIVTSGISAAADAGTVAAEAAAQTTAESAATEGALSMDFDFGSFDLGDYDYGSVFDSFDFTSGEGFQIFSDAQNVDFGFTSGIGDFTTGIDWGALPEDIGFNFESAFDWGSTFETTVSDFGTWFSNPALDPLKDEAQKYLTSKAISAVIGKPPAPAPKPQTPITTKSIANGVQDLAGAAMQLIGVRNAYSSTANQRETSQPNRYTGQLKPGGQTVAVERAGMNPWVLAGVGVLAIGAVWYASRKG